MNSFLSYMGGKSLLTKKIIPLIPQHQCYCEVFSGAAWLLFRKEESEVEIINDINSDLVTLYRRCLISPPSTTGFYGTVDELSLISLTNRSYIFCLCST